MCGTNRTAEIAFKVLEEISSVALGSDPSN
jgi:hypothetical protein